METEKAGVDTPIAIKKLTGMQVYTVTEGDCLGFVKDVLLDTSRKRAAALLVEEKGKLRDGRFVPFDKIQSIGEDAVIVADRGSIARASGMPNNTMRIMQRPATLYGTRIISTAGMSLGRLEEYHLDRISGEIRQLDLVGGRGHALSGRASMAGEFLLTIGRSAIMVDAQGAESLLAEQESQLKVTVSEMKEKAGQAWQTTVSASKKLGQNISSSFNRLLEEEETAKTPEQTDALPQETAAITPPDSTREASVPPPTLPTPPTEAILAPSQKAEEPKEPQKEKEEAIASTASTASTELTAEKEQKEQIIPT